MNFVLVIRCYQKYH